MKIKYTVVAFLIVLCTVLQVQAAEEFTLWNNQTFNAPFPAGGIVSSVIQNNNNMTGVEITMNYLSVTPDRCCSSTNYSLYAVIETQIAGGIWLPVAQQLNGFNNSANGPIRSIKMHPSMPAPDYEFVWLAGNTQLGRTSMIQGTAPSSFRVRIIIDPESNNDLQTFTVSATGKKYN
jgi:hypothetical protein